MDLTTAAGITQALIADGYVQLPPGIVILDEPIAIGGGQTLVGSGYSTRLHATGDFPCITMATQESMPVGVLVRDMRLTRQNTQSGEGGYTQSQGIVVWGQGVTISDVFIEDCLIGISLPSGLPTNSSSVTIERPLISNLAVNAQFVGISADFVNGLRIVDGAPNGKRNYTKLVLGGNALDVHGEWVAFQSTPATNITNQYYTGMAGNDAVSVFAPEDQPDVPRNVAVNFEAGWDGGDIIVIGKDQFGYVQATSIPSTPGGQYVDDKIFASVSLLQKTAVGVDPATCDVGTGNTIGIGLPMTGSSSDYVLLVDGVSEAVTVDREFSSFTGTTEPTGTAVFAIAGPVIQR